MALLGVSEYNFETELIQDLKFSVDQNVLEEPVSRSICIIANSNDWKCQVLSCSRQNNNNSNNNSTNNIHSNTNSNHNSHNPNEFTHSSSSIHSNNSNNGIIINTRGGESDTEGSFSSIFGLGSSGNVTATPIINIDNNKREDNNDYNNNTHYITRNYTPNSTFIHHTLVGVKGLFDLGLPVNTCIMHLEDRLQELYYKSVLLSEYVVEAPDEALTYKTMASKLGLEICDVPLVVAVASCHQSNIAERFHVSEQMYSQMSKMSI
eukprot:Lithocolla_globosa_v1_NODE_3828_length_1569_cov_19.417437.p1 type:complete len:264 gc:universal NODE_3828_length_1569_cov_19.417437:1165-374(-)